MSKLFVFTLFVLFYQSVKAVEIPDFMVLAPKILTFEIEENICALLYNGVLPAKLNLSIRTEAKQILTSIEKEITQEITCITAVIPHTKITKGSIDVEITFNNGKFGTIKSSKTIGFNTNPVMTFMETDKSFYKPAQPVKFRILSIDKNLRPITKPISKVWLENPMGARLAQWLNVSTVMGIAQLEYTLSTEPQLGDWKIFVTLQSENNEKIRIFTVKKYVLPRFQLEIEHEPNVLKDAKIFEWNFCGKYTYGRPVKGLLNITINNELNYIIPINNDNGCQKLTLSNEDLKLHWGKITVTASLKEFETDEIQVATIQQNIVQKLFEFKTDKKKFYKPYVPNSIKLTLLNSVNKIQIPNKLLEICIKEICKNLTTNAEGTIQLLAIFPNRKGEVYILTANTLEEMEEEIFNYRIGYSPSGRFLEAIINKDDQVECNKKLKFHVVFNALDKEVPSTLKFAYVVQSNGNLIKHGTFTKTKQSINVIQLENTNTLFGLPVFKFQNTNMTEDTHQLYTFDLEIDIVPEMSPVAKLLLFYTNENREVIATTVAINVNPCFKNKIKAEWKENELYPGELATLKVETTPNSLCTISVVDKSTNILAGISSKLTKEQFFNFLKWYQVNESAKPTQHEHCKICNELKEKYKLQKFCIPNVTLGSKDELKYAVPKFQSVSTLPSIRLTEFSTDSNEIDAMDDFESAGVLVLSNLTIETKNCYKREKALKRSGTRRCGRGRVATSVDRTPTKRTYFPETWLWDLVPTDEYGEIQFEQNIPHPITDWSTTVWCMSNNSGLGIGEPIEIRTFQPFFLDYILPYSIKRGEVVHLKVVLFNYLEHSLPVHVTLDETDGLRLVGDVESITACVKSRANIVHTFFIKAIELGNVNVTVIAETTANPPRKCGPEKVVSRRDVIVKALKVEPEGFPVQKYQSTYVCPKDSTINTTIRRVWEFKLPEDIVEDSARAKISFSGDILGLALQNLDRLIQIPMGCGEQNMLLFVPNLHVLNYMEALNIPNAKLKEQALKNMKIGYEREQNYRHIDASYSAFGESDEQGSLWLTSFVIRSFAQSRIHIFVDTRMLNASIQWIIHKQLENGCFRTVGVVLHKEMLGGLQRYDSNVGLTAYVIISLLESGLPIKPSVLEKARYCLAFAQKSKNDIYAKALTAYAFALLNLRDEAKTILKQLILNVKHEEDLVYWDNGDSTSLELSIEITSYVILCLLKMGNAEYDNLIFNAVRWLSTHRNEKGGFVSTQDTILALEALSKYAETLDVNTTNLNVKLTASGLSQEHPITTVDKLVLRDVYLPTLPTAAEILVSGEGCALFQGTLRYHVPSLQENSTFGLDVHVDTTQSSCKTQDVHVCTWYKVDSDVSNMAVLEIRMVSGFEPVESTLENLEYQNIPNFKRYENDKNQVNIYFSEVTSDRTCLDFQIMETVTVENRTAANIIIYDYYNNKLQAKIDYKIEKTCHLPNVPHIEPGVSVTPRTVGA